jgi:hypothetical protein
MWETIAAVAIATLTNVGALAYFLGGMKERVHSQGKRIGVLETKVNVLEVGFAAMKGKP